MKKAILSTSRLNSYGTRVLTEGIDTAQYAKNPILLWMHRRPLDSGEHLPLGKVEDLHVEGDALVGTPVFDQTDEFARQIESKWEQGMLRMTSIGIEIVETSKKKEHLLEGQTRPTITKSRLLEVSIVDIGANDDALQIQDDAPDAVLAHGMVMNFSFDNEETLDNLETLETLELLEQTPNNMNEELNQELEALREENAALREQIETLNLSLLNQTLDAAISERRIGEADRDNFLNLGKTAGLEVVKMTLSLLKPQAKRPSEVLNLRDGDLTGGQQTYERLSDIPAGDFETFRKEQPAEYARLYKETYGVELAEED